MKIYFATDSQTLHIEGLRKAYPARSLAFQMENATTIGVWTIQNAHRVAGPFEWSDLRDEAGAPFNSLGDAQSYLSFIFSQRETGVTLPADILDAVAALDGAIN